MALGVWHTKNNITTAINVTVTLFSCAVEASAWKYNIENVIQLVWLEIGIVAMATTMTWKCKYCSEITNGKKVTYIASNSVRNTEVDQATATVCCAIFLCRRRALFPHSYSRTFCHLYKLTSKYGRLAIGRWNMGQRRYECHIEQRRRSHPIALTCSVASATLYCVTITAIWPTTASTKPTHATDRKPINYDERNQFPSLYLSIFRYVSNAFSFAAAPLIWLSRW